MRGIRGVKTLSIHRNFSSEVMKKRKIFSWSKVELFKNIYYYERPMNRLFSINLTFSGFRNVFTEQWNSRHSNINLLYLVPMETCIQVTETNVDTSARQIYLGRNHIICISSKRSFEITETITKKGPQVTVNCSLNLLDTSTMRQTKTTLQSHNWNCPMQTNITHRNMKAEKRPDQTQRKKKKRQKNWFTYEYCFVHYISVLKNESPK